MSETRLRVLAVLTAVVLVGVIGVGAVVGSASAADDLVASSETALASAGLDGVAVEFHGREAQIRGGSVEDRVEARRILAGIEGVRSVRVISPALVSGEDPVVATDARLDLRRTPGGATISGVVPDPDAQVRIRAAAAKAFGPLTGDLTVDRDARRSDWVDHVDGVLDALVDVTGLQILIDGRGTVVLRGTVADEAARSAATQRVAATFPDLRVVDELKER